MKKLTTLYASAFCFLLLSSCTANPENYFDIAVLNVNMMTQFASESGDRELQSPSVKLKEGTTSETVQMTRKEVVENKIAYIEENYKKLQGLKETEETKNLLKASLALYEYVLPVYKKEYVQLADMYDKGEPQEKISAMEKSMHDNYYARFDALSNTLFAEGKSYATKNNIPVNWDVHTSPQ